MNQYQAGKDAGATGADAADSREWVFGLLANPRHRERVRQLEGLDLRRRQGCEPCLQALVTGHWRPETLFHVGWCDSCRSAAMALGLEAPGGGDSWLRRRAPWLVVALFAVLAIPLVGSQVVGDGSTSADRGGLASTPGTSGSSDGGSSTGGGGGSSTGGGGGSSTGSGGGSSTGGGGGSSTGSGGGSSTGSGGGSSTGSGGGSSTGSGGGSSTGSGGGSSTGSGGGSSTGSGGGSSTGGGGGSSTGSGGGSSTGSGGGSSTGSGGGSSTGSGGGSSTGSGGGSSTGGSSTTVTPKPRSKSSSAAGSQNAGGAKRSAHKALPLTT